MGLGVFGVWYLGSDRVKTIDNLAFFGGGSLSVGAISISDVWDYPEIDLTVRDLHVWEKDRTSQDSAFFVMKEGRIRLRADLLNTDTILVRQLTYNGGRLHLEKDNQNQTSAERMRGRRPASQGKPRFKFIGSPELTAGIDSVDFSLSNPGRGKSYAGFINHMNLSDLNLGDQKNASVDFDVDVKGLMFKLTDGAFAENTRIQGELDLAYTSDLLSINAPVLQAGNTSIAFEAAIFSHPDSLTKLHFELDSANMEELRPMLSSGLREKLLDYDVEGSFPAKLTIYRNKAKGDKSIVELDLNLRGNRARVQQYTFKNTYLNGVFFNRIPTALNDFNPTVIGSTFIVDTVSANGFGFDFTSADARVISLEGKGSDLEATVHAIGPSRSLSDLLNSDQYLFTKGEVEIQADVLGPLGEVTKLLDQSNGTLAFTKPTIRLVEAGVQLPLKHLTLIKQDNHATVDLEGATLSGKHAFHVEGELTGVSRVIGGANKQPVQSQVRIESDHLTWEDLSAYLGTKSHDDLATSNVGSVTNEFDPVSLKKVLSSIEESFQPKLDVAVDTLGYMDIALTNFRTGMHFQGHDTLVLERTSFLLDTARVSFGGSIDIGKLEKTSYQFSLKAKHVDVEQLLPKVNYLNSQLLSELNTLPNDVDVEVKQQGFIDDRKGIIPNSSKGFIDLVSNKQKAFRARVDFEPDRPNDPSFNSTHVNLEGNAVLFNDFFDTEDFLFKDGDFDFYMAYAGLVPDIRTLVQNEEMTLDIERGKVLFKSADLEIPINKLKLDMLRDTASVELYLRSDDLDQELSVVGVANNLSEVVLGESGKQFSTKGKVESQRIVWSDLNSLIGAFAGEKDTTHSELNLRKTTRAIMKKFRPDVHLRIGELVLNNTLAIQQVESGLRMNEQQRLFVDTTGFIYGNGSMKLAGYVDLENLELTPFDLYLNTDELNVASILEGFDHFGISSLKETDVLEGKVSLELDLIGDILGDGGKLVPETAKGSMNFSLFDLEVDGLKQIDDLAEKFRMTRRLDDLRFATLSNVVTIDSNRVHLPLMEIPTSAFRVFVAGDMEIGSATNFWVAVPLANLAKPDSLEALLPVGYAKHKFKVHVEFAQEEDLETKLRWSRRKYYKSRDELDKWKADRRRWRQDRKRARKAKRG